MKNLIIIIAAILMTFAVPTESYAQRQGKAKRGYDYKSHAKRNSKGAKKNTKKWKASGGDLTRVKCNRSRSKARRRR